MAWEDTLQSELGFEFPNSDIMTFCAGIAIIILVLIYLYSDGKRDEIK